MQTPQDKKAIVANILALLEYTEYTASLLV